VLEAYFSQLIRHELLIAETIGVARTILQGVLVWVLPEKFGGVIQRGQRYWSDRGGWWWPWILLWYAIE